MGYLKSPNRFLVYLARGCGEYKVSIGTARLGRDLYDDLRRSGDVGRVLMVQLGFPCTMTNRIAYGIAAAAWGGRRPHPSHVVVVGRRLSPNDRRGFRLVDPPAIDGQAGTPPVPTAWDIGVAQEILQPDLGFLPGIWRGTC